VAVYISFLFYDFMRGHTGLQSYFWFYQPVLVMALADPAAALCGRGFPIGIMYIFGDKKSLSGFVGFIIVAAIVTSLLAHFLHAPILGNIYTFVLLMSVITAVTELLASKGSDNFFIPLACIAVNYLWMFNIQV